MADKSEVSVVGGRFAQLFAAAVGSALIFYVNRASDESLLKLLVYFIPAVTLLISALSAEAEDLAKQKWGIFKSELSVKQFNKMCDKLLSDEHITQNHRDDVVARKNQLRLALVESNFATLNSSLEIDAGLKRKPTKRAVNRQKPPEG